MDLNEIQQQLQELDDQEQIITMELMDVLTEVPPPTPLMCKGKK